MNIEGIGFINPEDVPQPHPDNVGIGSVTCRCGGVSVMNATGYGAVSMLIGCPTCGEFSEAIVVRPEQSATLRVLDSGDSDVRS